MDAADPKPPPVPVAYAPAEGIGRRAFRTLVGLTFVNTVLLGLNFVGPTLTPFVRQQWADYQAARGNRAAEAQAAAVRRSYLPAQQLCLDYLDPPGTLRYAEDADGIATLEATGTAKHVGVVSPSDTRPPTPIGLPVGGADPACTTQMPAGITQSPNGRSIALPPSFGSILFLHERHSVAGPRLIVVTIYSSQDWKDQNAHGDDIVSNGLIATFRTLSGTIIKPLTLTGDAVTLFGNESHLWAGMTLVTVDRMAKPSRVTVDDTGRLRLYAGQPDAADPARFHIPYAMDGHRGTIDGQLTADDNLRLVPDRWLADREREWDEHRPQVPSPDVRRATGKPR